MIDPPEQNTISTDPRSIGYHPPDNAGKRPAEHVDCTGVLVRTSQGLFELQKQDEGLILPYLCGLFALTMIFIGVRIEVANFGLGLSQQFPTLSNGQSMQSVTNGLGYALGVALVMTHIVIQQVAEKLGGWFNWLLNLVGLVAVLLLVAGAMVFLAASIGQSSGDAGLTGIAPEHASGALGAILGALFPISVISNHIMSKLLVGSVKKIIAIWEVRREIATVRNLVGLLEGKIAALEETDHAIDEVNKPNALQWETAIETSSIIAEVTAILSDCYLVRQVVDTVAPKPGSVVTLPPIFRDMPIEQLKGLGDYLAQFTPRYIFDELKSMEA